MLLASHRLSIMGNSGLKTLGTHCTFQEFNLDPKLSFSVFIMLRLKVALCMCVLLCECVCFHAAVYFCPL